MPHKEAVLAALDEMSDVARSLGAVNCIVNAEGVLRGENTDGEGFLRGLAHETGQQAAGHTVAVIGAGGAARAIALACARADADSVMIINRTTERAEAAAALAPAIRVGRTDDITRATLVVNATSLGMAGTAGQDVLPFDVAMLSRRRLSSTLSTTRWRHHFSKHVVPVTSGRSAAWECWPARPPLSFEFGPVSNPIWQRWWPRLTEETLNSAFDSWVFRPKKGLIRRSAADQEQVKRSTCIWEYPPCHFREHYEPLELPRFSSFSPTAMRQVV